jgi:hypothetical protein
MKFDWKLFFKLYYKIMRAFGGVRNALVLVLIFLTKNKQRLPVRSGV